MDIIDHLLDFSKVNFYPNPDRSRKINRKNHGRIGSRVDQRAQIGGTLSLVADVALDQITEEVVEATVYSFCSSKDKQLVLDRRVSMIIDIDQSPDIDWYCRIATGGWKRICINLVSNALKYTDEGFIHVSLKAAPIPGKRKRFNTVLKVTDSGRGTRAFTPVPNYCTRSSNVLILPVSTGMSKMFVENYLFKAFQQEDTLSEGTGLGMSLVAKIVWAMNGQIEVESDKGLGTSVTVTLPILHGRRSKEHLARILGTPPSRDLKGKSIRIFGFDDVPGGAAQDSYTEFHTKEAGRGMLSASLQEICATIKVKVLTGASPDSTDADVYLATDAEMQMLLDVGRSHKAVAEKATLAKLASDKPLIVLCSSNIASRQLRKALAARGLGRRIELIQQPCGPERMSITIRACLEKDEAVLGASGPSEASPPQPLPQILTRRPLANGSFPANSAVDPSEPLDPSRTPASNHHVADDKTENAVLSSRARPPASDISTDHPKVHEGYFATRSKSAGSQAMSPSVGPLEMETRRKTPPTNGAGNLKLLLVDDNVRQLNFSLSS